jgi:hypothetical protein
MCANSLKLVAFDSTTVDLLSLTTDKIVGPEADLSLKLRAGTIRGEIANEPPYAMWQVTTPNAVFVVPGRKGTKFQISANGVAHVIEGVLAAVHIDPSTQKLTSFIVNAKETFTPPLNPSGGPTPPIVRPTREGEIISNGDSL